MFGLSFGIKRTGMSMLNWKPDRETDIKMGEQQKAGK